MKGHPTHVTVRPSRYSSFDPDRWWETRGGIRTGLIELQKLMLDVVLHPLSLTGAVGVREVRSIALGWRGEWAARVWLIAGR